MRQPAWPAGTAMTPGPAMPERIHTWLAAALVAYAERTLRKHPEQWVPDASQIEAVLETGKKMAA
jgi:hypothetical protein